MKNSFKTLQFDDCALRTTRIDIWQYSLQTEFKDARSLLNCGEIARADRYYFDKHRRRFIVARGLLRLILAHYTSIPPTHLIFQSNQYGKPRLQNEPMLEFNLSHSEDTALLAIGCTLPLGIDLEFFSARPYQGIGCQMFSSAENQALKNTTKVLQPLIFFHIWSQKEAFIKACGLGLSYPTKAFDVPVHPSTSQMIFDSLHGQKWQLISFQPMINCCAALCFHSQITDIRYHVLEKPEMLIK